MFGKFLLKCLAVLAVVIAVEMLLSVALMPPESYVRTQMNDFYNEESIDVIFVGSSHVYRGINPVIMDQASGKNTFNLSTSAQRLIDSYYLLKEAVRTEKNLKQVVLDINFAVLFDSGMAVQHKSSYIVLTDWKIRRINLNT